MTNEKKLCIVYPGLGYNVDKPLLYYAAKLARSKDYEILSISYENMPGKVLGDDEKMRIAFERGMESAEHQLQSVDFETYHEILFIGKSIGTAIGCAFAERNRINFRGILYTPIAETFAHQPMGIAFHGTKDPWVDMQTVIDGCRENQIPLYITQNANHSLETGDILSDISELEKVMRITKEFIQ